MLLLLLSQIFTAILGSSYRCDIAQHSGTGEATAAAAQLKCILWQTVAAAAAAAKQFVVAIKAPKKQRQRQIQQAIKREKQREREREGRAVKLRKGSALK